MYDGLKTASFELLLILVILQGSAEAANTLTVGPTPGPGIDYTSIQAAIGAASPGDTILVRNGTYYENVNVNKQLTLTGVGDPVVNAGRTGSAITLSADGCTLEGFEVTKSDVDLNAGIKVTSDGNTISSNTASGNSYAGIYLDSSSGNTISGNTATGNQIGIQLTSSSSNTISGNTATTNNTYGGAGIVLSSSSGNTVSGNTATSNGYGICLVSSSENTISGNTATGNGYGIWLYSSSDNIISGNTATDNHYYGIRLDSSSGNTIFINTATGNKCGIDLYSSSDNNIVTANTFTGNTYIGIRLYSSSGNIVTGNTATDNQIGIQLISSSSNTISGNTASDNTGHGIDLESSTNNIITGNIVSDDSFGIYLQYSSDNTIEGNIASNGDIGIFLYSSCGNTISGNTAMFNDQAGIYLTSSSGNTISGNTATGNQIGIQLIFSSSNTISGNTATSNTYDGAGIVLSSSSGNTISGNTATGNQIGIDLYSSSDNNIVTTNTATGNTYGIDLRYSSGNTISSNVATDNYYNGIRLRSSSGNTIYLNNLNLACSQDSTNLWNTPEPVTYAYKGATYTNYTGNYWSGYSGSDSNNDGIGDTPYTIDCGDENDFYPLVTEDGLMYATLDKTANLNSGAPSTEVLFTIKVFNIGQANLDTLTVQDELPYGLEYVSSTPPGTFHVENNKVIWNLSSLASRQSESIELVARINGFKYGPLENRANFTGTNHNAGTVEGNDTEIVTALQAGIDVSKSLDPESPTEGVPLTNVTFIINVTNTGDADFVSVTVEDLLPIGLDYVSDDSGVKPDKNENRYIWNLGSLNSSMSRSFNITARINGEKFGELVNIVNVIGNNEYDDQVEDSDTATVTAYSIRAGIEMEMTANPEIAALFSDVIFTINVTNTGEVALDPVVIVDELPDGMTYVSADPEPTGTASIRWDNVGTGSLAPGETATINLTARIDGNAKGPLVNLASATGCPPNGDNVSCSCSAEVHLPGLGVNKTADKKEYKRGEEITYTIVVENLAEVPVYDVVVRDVFNRGVEFVSSDPIPDPDGAWRFDMIPARGTVTIRLVVRVPKQDFEFDMDSGVSGEGFVNVANDYSTTLQPYSITNRVYVTSHSTSGEFSDSETVSVIGDPGTELETREHGSGTFDSDELVRLRTENKSISMEKDVSATFGTTTLGLYRNRTAVYSSKWTEEARAKNRVTGASMSESYRYATSIDRESRMFLDKNESVMEINSEFDGMGHIGFLKMPSNSSKPQTTPLFEAREDYTGSFKILDKSEEYGSSVTSEKSTSGVGLVAVDKRIGTSQRTYESGTGAYESEELIETNTNYIAKDVSLVSGPMNQSLTDDLSIDSSMKWKEGMYSKTSGTSFIGEEYTGVTQLDKETVARGLNEMDTEANFSGRARYRAIIRPEVDLDEQYEGDYSIQRKILFTGVPKYDRPHLTVTKTLDGIVDETIFDAKEETLAGESRDEVIKVATYTISIENDGNRALGPIYVRDLFPSGSIFIEPSSVRPVKLTDTYANWTLTHIAIGDVVTITLKLDVTKHVSDELVNRVEVCGGYNDEWFCASNFTAVEKKWLTCCPNETVSVSKTAELDQENPNIVWYRIDIRNLDDVTRVATVTDRLPEGMVLLDTSDTFASYENNTVTWNLVDIGAHENVTIAYRVKAQMAGLFVNSVEVDARSIDGPVVQPVYASSVIDIGAVEECEATSCTGWTPPNWDFEYVGYPAETTCNEICSRSP